MSMVVTDNASGTSGADGGSANTAIGCTYVKWIAKFRVARVNKTKSVRCKLQSTK